MRETLSALLAGSRVKVLIIKQETIHVATVAMFVFTKS